MAKILDKEFRNELYKNLCDAGYSKAEATSIVSIKYRDALKEDIIEKLRTQITNIEADSYETILNGEELNASLSELVKLKEFFEKTKK